MITETCWADPLSRKERRVLAEKLAHACGASYRARQRGLRANGNRWEVADNEVIRQHITTSNDLADLHMDVTERAAVPAR